MRNALLLLMLSGCVVPYGQSGVADAGASSASALADDADVRAVEARLGELLSTNEDLDRRDRLMAALDLARDARKLSAEARAPILNYLRQLAAIEARSEPYATPLLGPDQDDPRPVANPMQEESLDEPAPTPVVAPTPAIPPVEADAPDAVVGPPAPPKDTDNLILRARAALDSKHPETALQLLEGCGDDACRAATADLRVEARDAYVFERREQAGARYLATRELTDNKARADALRAVRDDLSALLARYPDTRYADALQRNIAMVSQELAALDAAAPR